VYPIFCIWVNFWITKSNSNMRKKWSNQLKIKLKYAKKSIFSLYEVDFEFVESFFLHIWVWFWVNLTKIVGPFLFWVWFGYPRIHPNATITNKLGTQNWLRLKIYQFACLCFILWIKQKVCCSIPEGRKSKQADKKKKKK
jgi:hypothetical protein